ncbi:hypothetical protein [Seonamhaeicola aphaedonensis]|uniref:Outer membrane protein with beta-barrel domain n=1 Tax=Seonamhaeicola aphaedonensis TaxID=1461338 RepID=A0A3D9HKE3_9FLAO|nr:hypothetical protein [Seonamhaeicola aphaedonensis]RED49982.1 hypothetical protein DFQ02_1012 [Seonamhaeicola aphaedonensis]
MKNIVFLITTLLVIECRGQQGFSFSYSTNNTLGIDVLAREGNNRLHFGYSHQFNGQGLNTENKKKEGFTETKSGKYFWACDFGYSRIFFNHLAVHSEVSIGASKKFANFKDDMGELNDYSLITCRNLAAGIGLKLGYLFKFGFEPFIGIHTLKKVEFGLRIF